MVESDALPLVTEFLGRWLDRKERPSITLLHAGEGAPNVLDTVDEAAEPGAAPSVGELADRMVRTAQAHADASSRPQRYAVAAQNARGRVLGQVFFRLAPPLLAGLEPGHSDTEAPTPVGAMAQSMRHTEAFARIHAESTGATVGNLIKLLGIMGKMVESAEAQKLETMRLTQELLDRKQARDLELRAAAAEQERMGRGLSMIEQGVIPMLAAHMSGASPVTELFRSLTQEQFQTILGCMTEQQIPHLRKILETGRAAEIAKETLLTKGAGMDNAPQDGSVGGGSGGLS